MNTTGRPQPFYFPLSPEYPVGRAALRPIGANQYGHGATDGHVFQFDERSDGYLQSKRHIVDHHGEAHIGRERFSEPVERAVNAFIVERLLVEHPERFDENELRGLSFEQLAMRVPEDLAVSCVSGSEDWLAAAHVCFPSGWSPREKLGESFTRVHKTVQITGPRHFLVDDGKVRDFAGEMVAQVETGVRFIWTLQVGAAFNRDPQTREAQPAFDADADLFFRVERQTVTGLPDVGAALFTIRTYLYPLDEVVRDADRLRTLQTAIEAMPPRVLRYKGWDARMVDYVKSL